MTKVHKPITTPGRTVPYTGILILDGNISNDDTDRRFGRTYRLHLQGKIRVTIVQILL